jgi:glycosyltransferase involved in cell wall biosynthesis
MGRRGHLLDLRWLGVGGIGATAEYLAAGLPADPPCDAGPWHALVPDDARVNLPSWVRPVPVRAIPGLRPELDPRGARGSSSLFVHQLRPVWASATVQYVHDLIQLDAPSRAARYARSAYLRRIVASSARILTVSDTSRERLVRWAPARSGDIEVARPPVVDFLTRRHGAREADPEGATAADERRDLLLCVARDKPHKNVDRLIGAYVDSSWQASGVALTVVLGGDARTVVARRQVPDGVRVLGHLPEPTLADFYRRAALVVCPSTDEGFGLPVVEAAWWGAPVSCSDIPVLREVAAVPAALRFDPCDVADIRRSLDAAFERFEQGRLGRDRPIVHPLPTVSEYTGRVLASLCRDHGSQG